MSWELRSKVRSAERLLPSDGSSCVVAQRKLFYSRGKQKGNVLELWPLIQQITSSSQIYLTKAEISCSLLRCVKACCAMSGWTLLSVPHSCPEREGEREGGESVLASVGGGWEGGRKESFTKYSREVTINHANPHPGVGLTATALLMRSLAPRRLLIKLQTSNNVSRVCETTSVESLSDSYRGIGLLQSKYLLNITNSI